MKQRSQEGRDAGKKHQLGTQATWALHHCQCLGQGKGDGDKMTPTGPRGGQRRGIKGQGRVTHEIHHGPWGAGYRGGTGQGEAPPFSLATIR